MKIIIQTLKNAKNPDVKIVWNLQVNMDATAPKYMMIIKQFLKAEKNEKPKEGL